LKKELETKTGENKEKLKSKLNISSSGGEKFHGIYTQWMDFVHTRSKTQRRENPDHLFL
jgi:hypothetical protein